MLAMLRLLQALMLVAVIYLGQVAVISYYVGRVPATGCIQNQQIRSI